MAVRKRDDVRSEPVSTVPTPVRDGYAFVQSLGTLVDEAMGHTRDGKSIGAFEAVERPTQGDPEPLEPPAPVPDGDESGTRGANPEVGGTK